MCLGIPGEIIEITDAENKLAIVSVAGVKRQINIACIVDEEHSVESCVGDWVVVHVGFALSRISEEEAARSLELLAELEEVQEEMEAMTRSGSPVQNEKKETQDNSKKL
jgi:hydrogenase expression/formation protein HypC